jgi:uncharacterized membrane protein
LDYSVVTNCPLTVKTVWVPGNHSAVFIGPNAALAAKEISEFVASL